MSWDPRKWDSNEPPKEAWILLGVEFLICLALLELLT